jgi:hypothetical protein
LKNSSVHAHIEKTGHQIDFDEVEIIDSASNEQKLALKEMLHINKINPKLNVQKTSYVFSMIIGRRDLH